ncbi:MAG: hypothetical protein Q4C96_06770 [Planctomycetia bacterium]|nr:hypothetical protein [Planctomycetia bacterium]
MSAREIPEKVSEDLEQILGHFLFSTEKENVLFYKSLDAVCDYLQNKLPETEVPLWRSLEVMLYDKLSVLTKRSEVFAKDDSVWKLLRFVFGYFIPKYRFWHKNILFHQSDDRIFQPFFLAQLLDIILEKKAYQVIDFSEESLEKCVFSEVSNFQKDLLTGQNGKDNLLAEDNLLAVANNTLELPQSREFPFAISAHDEFIATGATPYEKSILEAVYSIIDEFDDYVGYRPTPVLNTQQKMQPYDHEWVHPFPIFLKRVGIAHGRYHEILSGALKILSETHPDILQAASLDLSRIEELVIDPRALDFEHPVNRRLNYHFGGWDMSEVTNQGFYRRFVLIEPTLDSILSGVFQEENSHIPLQERMFEASAVLAGTMLMGSAVTGWGPGAHDSSVTFATLLPQVAQLRDRFYLSLMKKVTGEHGARLREESIQFHQPFAHARQYFNTSLARMRALQYQNLQLARLFAWMGYVRSAHEMLVKVSVPGARMRCEVDCLLTLAHIRIDRKQVMDAIPMLYCLERMLYEGIQCGAFVDPWYILGYSGQYPLSQSIEDSTTDHRIGEFVSRMSSIFSLYSRIMKAAAAQGMTDIKNSLNDRMQKLTQWWDQFGSDSILEDNKLSGYETWESAKMVVEALEMWHGAGTATGDIAFWRPIAAEFSSAKAYVLLVEALLDQRDSVASMALLINWLSQSEIIPLDDGDYSFHPLALCWMEDLWYPPTKEQHLLSRRGEHPQDAWEMAKKFIDYVEANADVYGIVPELNIPLAKQKNELEKYTLDEILSQQDLASLEELLKEVDISEDDEQENDEKEEGIMKEDHGDLDWEVDEFLERISRMEDRSLEEEEYDEDEEDEDAGVEEDDEAEEDILGAAWENVTYKDTTDDGNDSSMMESGTPKDSLKDFPLTAEMERVSDRLLFFITQARLWKMAAVFSIPFAKAHPDRGEALQAWGRQAEQIYQGLLKLLDQVNQVQIEDPLPTPSSLMDYDKRRGMKESLLDRIISTCSELLDAKRLMVIADTESPITDLDNWETATQGIIQALIRGDTCAVLNRWDKMLSLLVKEPLLYRPLSRNGDPRRIVRTRSVLTVMQRLLYNLPRQGFIAETVQLLVLAQRMEREHPAGMRSITRFDHLFQIGCKSIVHALLESAVPEISSEVSNKKTSSHWGEKFSPDNKRWTKESLFKQLDILVEVLMKNWVTHSRGIRISALDVINGESEWEDLKDFIQTYGNDLFSPMVMSYGNLQAIYHQGVGNWLEALQDEDDPEMGASLAVDLREGRIEPSVAESYLEIILETLLDRYGEFIDYNTTTIQSDKGENLYILLDFLRIRARYDRIAWDMFPILIIHGVMVRQNCVEIANTWITGMMERYSQIAEQFLEKYNKLYKEYGVSVKSVKDRLEERFVASMSINCMQALLEPAIKEARAGGDTPSFRKFLEYVQAFMAHPTGTGFESPRWLEEVEEEVQSFRNKSEDDDQMLDLKECISPVPISVLAFQEATKSMLQKMNPFQVSFLGEESSEEFYRVASNSLSEILKSIPDYLSLVFNDALECDKPNDFSHSETFQEYHEPQKFVQKIEPEEEKFKDENLSTELRNSVDQDSSEDSDKNDV